MRFEELVEKLRELREANWKAYYKTVSIYQGILLRTIVFAAVLGMKRTDLNKYIAEAMIFYEASGFEKLEEFTKSLEFKWLKNRRLLTQEMIERVYKAFLEQYEKIKEVV